MDLARRYKVPKEPHAGMAAMFGHSEYMELPLTATLKGGLPPPPNPAEGRKVAVVVRVLVQPRARPAGEALPAGVKAALTDEEEAAEAAAADKAKAGKKK